MTKSKNTKRALLASVLSLMLCMAMLVGSTFAWFTDSVTSGKNKIVAGNLDVELSWSTDGTNWERVNADTNMFDGALWEPGYTRVVYLKVENVGSLALKYKFGINVAGKVIGKTADDQNIDLSQYIKFGVVDNAPTYTLDDAGRTKARDAVKDSAVFVSTGYASAEAHLSANTKSNPIALVVYMPEETGNQANHGFEKQAPSIDLGINLVATQWTEESDSFGNQYDKNAEYPEKEGGNGNWYVEGATELTISTPDHLVDFAKRVNEGETFAGKTISLADNIVLDGVSNWVPIGQGDKPFEGVFDGKNFTVSGLNYNRNGEDELAEVGFFGAIYNATIKDLTVKGTITAFTNCVGGIYSCGGICGASSGTSYIQGCTSEVTIDGTKMEGEASAIFAAGILGSAMTNNGATVTIDNCHNKGNITLSNSATSVAAGIVSAKMEGVIVNENCTNSGQLNAALYDDIANVAP